MKSFNPEEHRIFECIFGSRLYGTDTPESDTDYRGICIPPMDVLLNPFYPFEQKDSGFEEEDRAIYALGKFMQLCADSNPNIVELLFIPESKTVFTSPYWQKILNQRDLFLSTKARYTFAGYAVAQFRRIKNHRQWFLDPPKKKPERKDFGLTDSPLISGDGLNNAFNMSGDLFKPEVHEELNRERNYRFEKKRWDNYVSWRDNRNPKRKELEDKYGYDTKYASHIFRLISEGKELLLTGKITFPLTNADEIIAIKNGSCSYEELVEKSEMLDSEFDSWYKCSALPNKPNRNKLAELYFEVIEEYHRDKN